MTAVEMINITERLDQILAQQIKSNALLRALLHQLQHATPQYERDHLDPALGVKDDLWTGP